jgi:hypothetical protein
MTNENVLAWVLALCCNINLVKYFINIMVYILKLGKHERSLLEQIRNGGELSGLTPSQRRSLKSLNKKGLIVKEGESWSATEKVNDLALTDRQKNKLRNDRRAYAVLAKTSDTNPTYMYWVKRIRKFPIYSSEMLQAVEDSDLRLNKVYEFVQNEVGRLYMLADDGMEYEEILENSKQRTKQFLADNGIDVT